MIPGLSPTLGSTLSSLQPLGGLGRRKGALEPAGRAPTRQPDHLQCLDEPLLASLCQKSFCLSLYLGHRPKCSLCFLASVCARPQEGDKQGKDPMLAQTCLNNIINKNKFSILEDLQEFLTLKRIDSVHYLYGVTDLTRGFVFGFEYSGKSSKGLLHGG